MPTAQLEAKRYDDDDAYYVLNAADDPRGPGDRLDSVPAIRDLQLASRQAILSGIRNGASPVTKVSVRLEMQHQVRGYVTLLRFIEGASLSELEQMLGFRNGALAGGCRLYRIDPLAIAADNIGPRYLSSWSAGVSPKDLDALSRSTGQAVEYHRDYPAASNPIPQFVLFRPVLIRGSTVLTGHDRVAAF